MIAGLKSFGTISFAEQFAKTAQLRAGPAFELAFAQTQNAVLSRLDKEIEKLQNQDLDTTSATIFLELQLARLDRDVVEIRAYENRTRANDINIGTIQDQIDTLKTFTSSATVTEFDAAKQTLIELLEKMDTPLFERFGAPDRLRREKSDALAELEALVHNNFATQADIDAVTATLDGIYSGLSVSKGITTINRDMAFRLLSDTETKISEIGTKIETIELTAASDQLELIKEERQKFTNILIAISLAFEASKNITNFVLQAVLPQKIPPGSVLNLFS